MSRKNQLTVSDNACNWPKYQNIPEHSTDPKFVYREVQNILRSTSKPKLNLGSFSSNVMDEYADIIILEGMKYNFINHNEYPEISNVHNSLLRMIGNLFHVNDANRNVIGTSTVGSSEACLMAGLAMKKNWEKRKSNSGAKPNIIFGSNAHVTWAKFARYFDVEARILPLNLPHYVVTREDIEGYIDEGTIGICLTLGSTLTGEFDDLQGINRYLEQLERETDLYIPLHVDAASGGFVVPFLYPELIWDFKLSHVVSINVSGHKYGLVYPGLGWIIWRDEKALPKELVFKVDYLKGGIDSYSLNFTRPAGNVLAQYYNFISLGKKGFTEILTHLHSLAGTLKLELQKLSIFRIINNKESIPVVIMALNKDAPFSAEQFSEMLGRIGWLVPTSMLETKQGRIEILRIVLRRGFTSKDVEKLIGDITTVVNKLMNNINITKKECV